MKKLFLSILSVCTMIIVSCGDKNDKLVMTPESTEISGDLSEYFEVVDQEYAVALKDGHFEPFATWSIKVRRTDDGVPFDENAQVTAYGTTYFDGRNYCKVGFGLEIFDADNNSVDKISATGTGLSGPYSSDDILDLFKLKVGEEGTIRWLVDDKLIDAKKPLKFKITSAYDEGEGGSTTDISNDDDIDDIFDEAGKIVDKAYKDADRMMKNAQKDADKAMRDAQKQADEAMKAAMKAAGY
ncbi:MAG: hypothetical protein J5605_05825 [Bacteroidales bacterium]|nr:hypothetical protein [Bacteroidales bacterium]